ncbi:MAG: hypothetical protein Q8O01_07445, partial [Candidatus Omnitrophota bacterium]|nr:hypothetical protein [Candidatus Omnitrophota bacterium]
MDGISASIETFYSVDLSKLIGSADLKKVSFIYIVVEGDNKTGTLEINKLAESGWIKPSSGFFTIADINIPGTPGITAVNPLGADAKVTGTVRGEVLQYDTHEAGWSGGGFSYDNFSTPAIETYDLSGLSNLIIGLKGSPSQVKLEVVDNLGNKGSVQLTGVSAAQENIWAIPKALLLSQGIDLTKVRIIYFIVEGDKVSGTLEINKLAPSTTPIIGASTTLTNA